MAGLIFGSDLGLTDSSLRMLKDHFNHGRASLRQGGIGYYVNASTGNLVLTDEDDVLVGRGLDIVAERTYNSQGDWSDSDANGWRFGFERQLILRSQSSLTLLRGDGSRVTYRLHGSTYQNQGFEDESGQFVKSGSQYVYTNRKTGAQDVYNADGYLISSTDADGNQRTYQYSQGKLTEIRFGNNERMSFDYAADGQLSSIKIYADGHWTTDTDYSYDSQGRLKQVRSVWEGKTFDTNYQYDGNSHRISMISQSDGSKISFTYDAQGRVSAVTDGTDHVLNYSYAQDHTQLKDSSGRVWRYYFDAEQRLTRAVTPQISSFNVSARSNDTQYYYDTKGHLSRIHDVTAGYDVVSYTYDEQGNRIQSVDAEGNRTEWRYDGMSLVSETVYLKKTSVPVTSRYVYDSEKHLRYVIDAEGRVTSRHYNAVGTLAATIQYGANYDLSSLAVTDQLSLTQMDQWRATQDKASTSRTDYFYDGRDQLTETRGYAQVDTKGNGVANSAMVRTKYVYDQYGLLRQKIAVRDDANYITSYSYDHEGRITLVTDANGYSTSTEYQGNTVKVTNAEGMVVTSTYDAAGRLISTDTSDGTIHRLSRRFYNANGQLAMSESPTGQRTFYFYDEAGRPNAVVSHDGMVTETVYNVAGQVAYKRVYWNHVDTKGWFNGVTVTKTSLSQFRPTLKSSQDRTTSYTYDKVGHIVSMTDAEQNGKSSGQVVSYTEYDSAGRILKTTRGDRTQFFIYDKTGKQVGFIDEAGYLTEKKYNTQGQLVETIVYSQVTDVTTRGSGDLSKIRPDTTAADHHAYTYYDGMGRVRATVNAAGELTETVYNEYNNRIWTYRYQQRITATIDQHTAISQLQTDAGGTDGRTSVRKDFDKVGQLKTIINANGITSTFEYDKVGHLTTTSTGNRTEVTTYDKFGSVTQIQKGDESLTTVYDRLGRKIQQIDGEGHKTLYFYDEMGRLTHTVNALGEVGETTYDNLGQVSEVRQYYQRISTTGLNGGLVNSTLTGRLKVSDSDINTHHISYDRLGHKVSEQNGLNLKSEYTYNEFGELTRSDIWKTTGGLRNITDYTYTSRGRVQDTIHYGNNAGVTTDDSLVRRYYDAFGHVVRVDSGNRTTVQQRSVASLYDQAGRERFTMNASGYVTEKQYNAQGQLVRLIEHGVKFSGSWSNESTVAEWLKSQDQTGDRVTVNEYDPGGRLIKVTDALGHSESYTYDENGNKTSFTNKQGHTWNYEYDKSNRLVRELAPAVTYRLTNGEAKTVTARPDTRFYYDGNGNLIKQIEGFGTSDARTTEYQYDAANRQTKILQPGYYSSSDGKVYFSAGEGRVRQTKTVTYNAFGLAVAQTDNMGSTTPTDWQNSYKVYDRTGRVRFEIDSDGFVTEYQYLDDAKENARVKVIRYAKRFNLANIDAGTAITEQMASDRIVKDANNDRTLTRYFDRQGRVTRVVGDSVSIYTTTGGNKTAASETQYTYNEFGEVIQERTRIDATQWAEKYTYYDDVGRKTAQFEVLSTDGKTESGYLTQYTYNAFGQLNQQVEYARLLSRSVSATSTAPGKPAAGDATIGFDRYTGYDYDALGRKTKESRWDVSPYQYYSDGNKSGGVTRLTTQTGYDALGNVIYTINAAGGRTDTSYDALGRQIRHRGVAHWVANGWNGFGTTTSGRHETEYEYSLHGDLVRQHDIDSSEKTGSFYTTYQLDARGNRVAITNGDGITTFFSYDARGRTLSEKVKIDTDFHFWTGKNNDYDYWLTKSYLYDKRGNQIQTDVNGRTEQSRYNAFGEVSQSGKNGQTLYTYSYNKSGYLVRKVQQNGDVVSQAYDLLGRNTYQIAAGGSGAGDDWKTYSTYNRFGFLLQSQLPEHKAGQQPVIHQTVDRWGNVIRSVNALGGITNQRYNINNQVVWEQLPQVDIVTSNGQVQSKAVIQTYDYDKLGNVVRSVDGRQHVATRTYDSAGLLVWERNGVGALTQYRYDSFGNRTYTKNALGNVIMSTYNKRGLITSQGEIWNVAPGVAYFSLSVPVHRYEYDQAGRRIKDIQGTGVSNENGTNTLYTVYDASGNVIAKRNLEHVVTRYEFDQQNRKIKETHADGRYIQWWYDDYGNIVQQRDLSGRITKIQLNAHKQVVKETNGDNVNTYTYWNNGALKSVQRTGTQGWAALAEQLSNWTALKRNQHVVSVSNLYRSEISSYDYDKMGNRTQETHSSQRNFTRNLKQVASSRYGNQTTNTSESFAYGFKRATTYSYNARGQLVSVQSPQQAYTLKVTDTTKLVYGKYPTIYQRQTNTSGLKNLQYFYDEVGNRRRIHADVLKAGTSGAREVKDYYYTYDAANRIVMADAASITGGYKEGTQQFIYDNLDRRVREITRSGGKYNHEQFSYLLSSGLISTSSKVNNAASASTSVATYRQSYRQYDHLGRLTAEHRYAISNGETNSHVKRGDEIGRSEYQWGNGSILSKQTNYHLKDLIQEKVVLRPRPGYGSRSSGSSHSRYGGGASKPGYGGSTTPPKPIYDRVIVRSYHSTVLRKASEVIYNNYDPTGNIQKYTVNVFRLNTNIINKGVRDVVDYTEVHTKSYFFGTGAQQMSASMTTTRSNWHPNNTHSYFDNFGELMYVRGSNARAAGYDRMLFNNRDGQVLFRKDADKVEDFYYANTRELGKSGTLSPTNFSSHVVNSTKMQQSSPGVYAVANGDSLQSIAQKLWGDAGLWYLIADANALDPTIALQEGMSLSIPTVNNNVHNSDQTFKPYNPADAVGKTDAEAVYVPPPSNHGCATMIVTIVVIVVAVVVTQGVGSAMAASAGSAGAGAGATAAGTGAASWGVGTTIAATAAGSAAGNAAGQLVSMALGVQNGFDAGAVFKAGARGALAGAAGYLANILSETSTLSDTVVGQIATRSAVQIGSNYMTNQLLEGHSQFSWKSFAASVAGSMTQSYIGQQTQGMQKWASDFASSFAGGYTSDVARQWMGIGGKQGVENIAADAFGSALGNSIVRARQAAQASQTLDEEKRTIQKAKASVAATPGTQNDRRDSHEPVTQVFPLPESENPKNFVWDEHNVPVASPSSGPKPSVSDISVSGSWNWSEQCTVDNPLGLSQAEVADLALRGATDLMRSRVADRLNYTPPEGPQLKPINPENQARIARTNQYFFADKPLLEQQIGQGVLDGLTLYAGTRFRGMAAAAYKFSEGLELFGAMGASLYDSGVLGQIGDSGQFTLMLKGSFNSGVSGYEGGYLSVDFNDWKFKIGRAEGIGGALSNNTFKPGANASFGIEVYPTYDHYRALNGGATDYSYSSSLRNYSYTVNSIRTDYADNMKTKDWHLSGWGFSVSPKIFDLSPSKYSREFSYGFSNGITSETPFYELKIGK
ncbi:DUF6531 domain-containing protein [Vibrio sp. MEBiC08052]|uniref:DUF6531 domain-containing protein n=1 Tax=Vibrio sp. MEBiC08052 TaxID=1761910 RepID=UPI0007405A0B|nr:DUF6531 domain-containing protein [Vibrio sp. MEBiC08052]KUI97041.1 hypothetical protein VRK_38960 [Vibrio sp. MEBiC08052]